MQCLEGRQEASSADHSSWGKDLAGVIAKVIEALAPGHVQGVWYKASKPKEYLCTRAIRYEVRMSGRGMQGSLSVQADRLKKTMQNRDQRRRKEQNQRAVSLERHQKGYSIFLVPSTEHALTFGSVLTQARNDQLDPYERSQKATGGVRLGPGSAALAAVADVAALEGPAILRCEPCQVCPVVLRRP